MFIEKVMNFLIFVVVVVVVHFPMDEIALDFNGNLS